MLPPKMVPTTFRVCQDSGSRTTNLTKVMGDVGDARACGAVGGEEIEPQRRNFDLIDSGIEVCSGMRSFHPTIRLAEITVFFSTMAMVTGPTPPGTG